MKSRKISEIYLQKGNHDDVADVYEESVISGYNNADVIREKYFELLDEAVSLMNLSPGLRVLDIGIGTGLLTERMPKDILLFGIDISPKMLKVLKKKNLSVKLKYGSFLDIPYKDNYFNRVISTICFSSHPLRTAARSFR